MLDLKLNINDIGPGGVQVERRFGAEGVRALVGETQGYCPTEAAWGRLSLHLDRAETTVLARGALAGWFQVECSRCLGPAAVKLDEPQMTMTYLPPPASGPADEAAGVDDVDTYAHDGESIDLEPMLRELFVLAIPMAPLCDPACRGICTECGADRNREPCGCGERTSPEPTRWAAALSKLRDSIPK